MTHNSIYAKLDEARTLIANRKYKSALSILNSIITSHKKNEKKSIKEANKLRRIITRKINTIKNRLIFLSLFGGCIFCISLLHSFRIPSSEIIAEIETNYVLVNLKKNYEINSIPFKNIVLSNVKIIDVKVDSIKILSPKPLNGLVPIREIMVLNPYAETFIKPGSFNKNLNISGSDCYLQSYLLKKDHPIIVSLSDNYPKTINIQQVCDSNAGTIQTSSTTLFESNGCTISQGDINVTDVESFILYHSTYEMGFLSEDEFLNIEIILPEKNEEVELNNSAYRLNAIDFTSVSGGEPYSLINKATLNFYKLSTDKIEIEKNEFLLLNQVGPFFLKRIVVNNHLQLLLQGKAGKIRKGFAPQIESCMPTILNYLIHNKNINIIIAATSGVFTFLLSLIIKLNYLKN